MSDFEKSNSNIFADLGDPEAEQTLVRAQILSRIIDIINERNFTEAETAETLGISKLEASQLIKGKLSQFSLEDLFHILNALDKPRNPEVLNVEKSRTKFDIIDRVCGKKFFLGVGVSSRSFQALLPLFFVPSYVLQEG
jgi:predicted XRE-type DNA-binding protein